MFNWERKGLGVLEEVLFLARVTDLILQFTLSSCSSPEFSLASLEIVGEIVAVALTSSSKVCWQTSETVRVPCFLWLKNLLGPKSSLHIQSCKCLSLRSTITIVPVIQPHKWFVTEGSHSGVKESTQETCWIIQNSASSLKYGVYFWSTNLVLIWSKMKFSLAHLVL